MASQVTPPRGMRDFLPQEQRRRQRALATIREVYREHGFDEIETPALEESQRLHAGVGGDNEKLSFAVLRRGLSADDLRAAEAPLDLADLGLRYDLTVPLSRFVATHRGELPNVFRAVQLGPVWRAERPQKGRYRQFVQCDIDILGEPGLLAEAELLTAGTAALARLGLADCTIRVNDRRLLNGLLDWCGIPADATAGALITIDKLDKIGVDGVTAELAQTHPGAAQRLRDALAAWAPQLDRSILLADAAAALPADLAARDAVQQVAADLAALAAACPGAPLVFDPTLVRGMGYYTGTIFEVAHPASGSSVGGGGRYDGMIGRFLGQDVPACGFSLGFERIVDLLPPEQDAGGESVLVLIDKSMPVAEAMRLKAELQQPGRRVRLEKRPKNIRNLLDRAAAEGFTHVAHARADEPAPALEPLHNDMS